MSLTLLEKIWNQHAIVALEGGAHILQIDRVLLHERTGGVALKSLSADGRPIFMPERAFGTMDHIVDTFPGRTDETKMPSGRQFITTMREECAKAGIRLFDMGDPNQGIVHVMSPELGIVLPGLTLVCPDSHTCTQGAFGAMAWGIGSSEAEHALATGTLRMTRPKSMRVTLTGAPAADVTAKDIILALIAREGSAAAIGHAIEFAGDAVTAMDMEARMTLCNMAVEMSAVTAIIAPDDKTADFLKNRPYAPKGANWLLAEAAWRELKSDPGARFDREITLDVSTVAPMVSWGTSPEQTVAIDGRTPAVKSVIPAKQAAAEKALSYMGLAPEQQIRGLPIDAAFIGSCTNSRLSDLRRAAEILRGRKVARSVRALVVPGSSAVKAAAEAEGLDAVFRDAGFEWRESGCSMCFFAGGESFGFRERVISSTNRNFESRQGPETRTHIASPETVAASAILGRIGRVADLETAGSEP